jgi:hypothetical protein
MQQLKQQQKQLRNRLHHVLVYTFSSSSILINMVAQLFYTKKKAALVTYYDALKQILHEALLSVPSKLLPLDPIEFNKSK